MTLTAVERDRIFQTAVQQALAKQISQQLPQAA